jgi:hypothetical protein
MESLPPWVGDASAVTILVSLISGLWWLIATGRMIPKAIHDAFMEMQALIIASKDDTIKTQDKQIVDLLEAAQTTKYVMGELVEAARVQSRQRQIDRGEQ